MTLYPVPKKSPLCQTIERDGRAVHVEIYSGDPGNWILEIVDEFNNSTVWDDHFQTDREALAEAFRTVEEEGIASLVGPPSNAAR